MTTGEKIAQKRKELSLSQEALGEKLGLSRQAIYKWESDAALPEIDKLVALSKLFGVSVGWLLGAEEPATGEGPEGDPGRELSEKELQLVEEIASRYLAAQPQQTPKQKGGGFFAAFLVAMVAAAVLLPLTLILFWRMSDLEERYYGLQSSTNRIYANIEQEMGAVTNRVEEILKTQNSLLADYRCELTGADLKENTVTFSLRATPKTWAEGLSALFVVNTGEEYEEFPAPAEEDRSFSGELTVPLTDSITLSVVLTAPDGAQTTQDLGTHTGLYARSRPITDLSLSPQVIDADSGAIRGTTITLPGSPGSNLGWDTWDPKEAAPGEALVDGMAPAAVVEGKYGLFKDGELLCWYVPGRQPDWNIKAVGKTDDFLWWEAPEMTFTLEPGEVLQRVRFCRDSYGRVLSQLAGAWVQDTNPGRLLPAPDPGNGWELDAWSYPRDNHGWPLPE